jgi:hypothetical protein
MDRTETAMDGGVRLAGAAAVLAGVAGLGYGLAFVVLGDIALSAAVLMVGGLLAGVALTGVYRRLGDSVAARCGLALGIAGAFGAVVHGAFDLAVTLHPVPGFAADAPNPVDPRGVLTFGAAGLGLIVMGLIVLGRLARRAFPAGLGVLAGVTGAVLVLRYLARLVVLNPASPLVLGPALLSGFVLSPLLYVWLGVTLTRGAAR